MIQAAFEAVEKVHIRLATAATAATVAATHAITPNLVVINEMMIALESEISLKGLVKVTGTVRNARLPTLSTALNASAVRCREVMLEKLVPPTTVHPIREEAGAAAAVEVVVAVEEVFVEEMTLMAAEVAVALVLHAMTVGTTIQFPLKNQASQRFRMDGMTNQSQQTKNQLLR